MTSRIKKIFLICFVSQSAFSAAAAAVRCESFFSEFKIPELSALHDQYTAEPMVLLAIDSLQ